MPHSKYIKFRPNIAFLPLFIEILKVLRRVDSLGAGVSMAETIVHSGKALQKMQDLAEFIQQFSR